MKRKVHRSASNLAHIADCLRVCLTHTHTQTNTVTLLHLSHRECEIQASTQSPNIVNRSLVRRRIHSRGFTATRYNWHPFSSTSCYISFSCPKRYFFLSLTLFPVCFVCFFSSPLQSVVRCLWHPKLNQIMVGTGNGLAKVYYDPVKSQRCSELQSPSSSIFFTTAQGEILAVCVCVF